MVLKSVLENRTLSNAKVVSVLQASGNLKSDHYLTEVLIAASQQVKSGDPMLKDAYRAAAKKLDSETYYGRAMRAID
jgi:disulfide oxidoreductase YuzD